MSLSNCITKINKQGRELIEHGTPLLPIACYYDDLLKEDVSWHWHDEWEAIIVSEGSSIVAVGNEKYTVNQGEGIFINAGILHAAWSNDPEVCRFHSLVFHPRLIGGSIDSIYWQNYVQPVLSNTLLESVYFDKSLPWHQKAIDSMETAWQSCVNETFGYEFEIRAALSQLILHLSNYHPSPTEHLSEKTIRNHERIKIMLLYIQEHYEDPISVSDLASQVMISESECLRCFRDTISTSPIQYLKQFRIQKAADLLLSTKDKITDISAQCGFQDTSYFIKSFRKSRHMTPKEYRELQINQN